jgi:hypothetical protein
MGRFVVIASTTVDVSNKKLNLLAAVLHAAERHFTYLLSRGLMARWNEPARCRMEPISSSRLVLSTMSKDPREGPRCTPVGAIQNSTTSGKPRQRCDNPSADLRFFMTHSDCWTILGKPKTLQRELWSGERPLETYCAPARCRAWNPRARL